MTNTLLPEPTAEDRSRDRFFIASTAQPPTDEQRAAVKAINEAVVALAVVIDESTPHSRNKSLALTTLEDVSMRANRAIFATGPIARAPTISERTGSAPSTSRRCRRRPSHKDPTTPPFGDRLANASCPLSSRSR
ncbi:DUF7681 family protein [Brevibacterium sediminis]|uniref:Acb2/Tad1 domain-containing protein n=1 Tax=Brevibacterium sediminis TaxID=1857024 RepID=UPI003B3A7730